MIDPGRPTLLLYRRQGCHLCDEAREALQGLLEERAAAGLPTPIVREVDIDEDALAGRRYLETIPVLALEGHELALAIDIRQIRDFLDRALRSALV